MQHYTNINSKLYADLFEVGGDNLLAVYAKLKYAKNVGQKAERIKIYKEQNRNIYHTLKQKTNISVTTLRKYIKILIKENLCYFDTKGNFVLIGTNKINKKYGNKKVVPIEIGSYKETKLFSFRVRVIFMEKQQKKAIDRKAKQTNIIARQSKGYFTTMQERNFLKRCDSKVKDIDYSIAKTVLSNQGFSKLKHGEDKSKSSGHYHKNKLVKAKIIQVERRFQFLRKGTILDYLENREFDRTVVYKNGRIYKELVAHFTTDIKEAVVYKKLSHLQFDVIDWWINGGK